MRRVFLLIAVALLMVLPAWGIGPNPDNNPSGNDILLWHLDDPSGSLWTDSSGNGLGSTTAAVSAAGLFGTAVSGFPGTGMLSAVHPLSNDLTVEAWIYWPAGAALTGCQTIAERRGTAIPFIFYTGAIGAGQGVEGQLTVYMQPAPMRLCTTTDCSFQTEKWYHVAFTMKNGPGVNDTEIRIYVTPADQMEGGPILRHSSIGRDMMAEDTTFRIGGEAGHNGTTAIRVFKGYIDEVRVSSAPLSWFDSFGPVQTCSVSGTVYKDGDESAKIPGAVVRAGGLVTTTDINGAYTLTNVPITTPLPVSATAGGYYSAMVNVATVAPGGSYTAPIAMTPMPEPCSVSGIVSDGTNPVSGATVRCSDGQVATTDAGGAYDFHNVPAQAGNVTVTAWAPGYRTGSATLFDPYSLTDYDLPITLVPLTGITVNPNNNDADVLLWHLNDPTGSNWADSSGSNMAGKTQLAVLAAPGLFDGAAGPFDATIGIFSPPYTTPAGESMTVQAYVYWPAGVALGDNQVIACRRQPDGWALCFGKFSNYGVASQINFNYYTTAWKTVSTTAAGIVNDQWYHVAVTVKHNGTNNNDIKIYLTPVPTDGSPMPSPILKGEAVGMPDLRATPAKFTVGADPTANRQFKGRIDEVRLTSGALLASELYGTPPTGKCTISGIVHEYGDPTARIEGATVWNTAGGATTTDANGAYSFVDVPFHSSPIEIFAVFSGFREGTVSVNTPAAGGSYVRDIALYPAIRRIWWETVHWQKPPFNIDPMGGNPMGHAQVLIDGNKSIISEGDGGVLLYADEQIDGTAFVKTTPKWTIAPNGYGTKGATILNGRLYSQFGSTAIHQSTLPTWDGIMMADGPWCPGMPTGRTEGDSYGLVTDGTHLYGSDSPSGSTAGTPTVWNGPAYIYKWAVDPNANGGNGALTEVWKVQIPTSTWLISIGYWNGKLYAAEGFRGRNIYEIDCATGAYQTILTEPNLIPTACGTDAWYMGQVARCGNRLVLANWTGHLTQWVLEDNVWVLKSSDLGVSPLTSPNYLLGLSLKPGADGNAKYAWVSCGSSIAFVDLRPTTIKTPLANPDNFKSGYTANINEAVVTVVGVNQFWVENKDRTVGARVLYTPTQAAPMPLPNTVVSIKGTGGKTGAGEKFVTATQVTTIGQYSVSPLFTTNKNLGPAAGSGLGNDGMLVKVSGKITGCDNTLKSFYIDDGSGVANDTPNGDVYNALKGVKVCKADGSDYYSLSWDFWGTTVGHATVVGVVRLEKLTDGTIVRRIDVSSNDAIVITPIN